MKESIKNLMYEYNGTQFSKILALLLEALRLSSLGKDHESIANILQSQISKVPEIRYFGKHNQGLISLQFFIPDTEHQKLLQCFKPPTKRHKLSLANTAEIIFTSDKEFIFEIRRIFKEGKTIVSFTPKSKEKSTRNISKLVKDFSKRFNYKPSPA